jgi:hypothetical protein
VVTVIGFGTGFGELFHAAKQDFGAALFGESRKYFIEGNC